MLRHTLLTFNNFLQVIDVDWKYARRFNYRFSKNEVPEVADCVARLLVKLHMDGKIDLKRTTIIGHSLG